MERLYYVGAWVAGTLAAAVLIGWGAWCHPSSGIGIDDSNITFVYARNLAEGRGFVYNPGGERVEGATSLLWTLLVAGMFKLGGDESTVWAAGIALFALTQFVAARILLAPAEGAAEAGRGKDSKEATASEAVSDSEEEDSPGLAWGRSSAAALLLYFALVLSCPGYIVWTTLALMDATLWGAVLAAAAWFVVHPPRSMRQLLAAAAVWAGMVVVRPEAMLFGPAFALLSGWNAAAAGRKQAIRTALVLGGTAVAAAVLLALFRWGYFGYPLPNTYYAKVSGSLSHNLSEGLRYVGDWLRAEPIAAAGVALAALLSADATLRDAVGFLGLKSRSGKAPRLAPLDSAQRGAAALSMAILHIVAAPLLTGGDHFKEFRFLQPAYPLLCVLLVSWVRRRGWVEGVADRLARLHPLAPAAAFAGIVCFAAPAMHRVSWAAYERAHPLEHEFQIARDGRRRGEVYNQLFASRKSLPSVGVVTAGGVAWTYHGRVVDLMGLNDVKMGHSSADRTQGLKNHGAFDEAIFYELRPDFLDGGVADGPMGVNPRLVNMLLDSGRFAREYIYGVLSLANDPKVAAAVTIRRELLDELLAAGKHRFQPLTAEYSK